MPGVKDMEENLVKKSLVLALVSNQMDQDVSLFDVRCERYRRAPGQKVPGPGAGAGVQPYGPGCFFVQL